MFFLLSCQDDPKVKLNGDSAQASDKVEAPQKQLKITVAAERMDTLMHLLKEETVAVVANQTSRVGEEHLVDSLLALEINITKVFSPEHGFRGKADAGASVKSGVDQKTGLPIISLYGSNKKPTEEQLSGLTAVVFDIQDVGARFYTYISTLHYVMEVCAEEGIKVIVLDRPNPNGHYVDGPVRKSGFESFVGKHPIPIVHGMTVGEIAQMINGEGWLETEEKCDLHVLTMQNYAHDSIYHLPIAPSPNLRSDASITLYPSLCLFEGTAISVGRGTDHPFEVFGHPSFKEDSAYQYSFVPTSGFGSKYPKLEGETCYGIDLGAQFENKRMDQFNISWLVNAYKAYDGDAPFFNKGGRFFDLLAGSSELRESIIAGTSVEEIRARWQADLDRFKQIRQKYLLYP